MLEYRQILFGKLEFYLYLLLDSPLHFDKKALYKKFLIGEKLDSWFHSEISTVWGS